MAKRKPETPKVVTPPAGPSDVIEHIETGKLIPYAKNSNVHSERQIAQIAGSIKEFGFCNPVLIDESGTIIAGHGRVLAAQLLNLATCPCRRLSHLSDKQRRAYVIADNRLAKDSTFDNAMLNLELIDLKDMGFELDVLGFGNDELQSLLILEPESESGDDGSVALESDDGKTIGDIAYRVVVLVNGELEQAELIAELEARGLECQPLMS
jgi:hypothetical protein